MDRAVATAAQIRRVRRQLAAAVRQEFATFLMTMTQADLDAIVARAIANRQADLAPASKEA